ncbi:MAG: hypothetical protein HY013_16195 [Candidatus Solibacter usitatus]|nr:hypothetical protein [Candidatus Solibacter usitatus]
MGAKVQVETEERIVLAPGERREAVLEVIRAARRRLVLSLFRCSDFKILDALAEAVERKVSVQALLTPHAKGWAKRLNELEAFLKSMGADVRRYGGPIRKYHAKYIVADEGPALVASLNFTKKCFRKTCDFLLVTHDAAVASGLARLFAADFEAAPLPDGLGDRLIVSPDHARAQIEALFQEARRSIRIIDHKFRDPAMKKLVRSRAAAGLEVEVLGDGELGDLEPHGKLFLVDDSTAVIGSIALSGPSLDSRREVAILIRDKHCVAQLHDFFRSLA